jgi:hypothetical protein
MILLRLKGEASMQKTHAHCRSSKLEIEDIALLMQALGVAVMSSSKWFHHKAAKGEHLLCNHHG